LFAKEASVVVIDNDDDDDNDGGETGIKANGEDGEEDDVALDFSAFDY
jgi:hypothetical protein